MSILELRFADGQMAALTRYKLGWPAPTNPTVQNSATLRQTTTPPMSPQAKQNLAPPTDPQQVAQIFSAHEQGETRTEPLRKLSTESLCTTCRKAKHYGSCDQPRPIPTKTAFSPPQIISPMHGGKIAPSGDVAWEDEGGFHSAPWSGQFMPAGDKRPWQQVMLAHPPKMADFNAGMNGSDPTQGNNPATSPHYNSATSSISSLARASDGRPAADQAGSGFADLFRHQGIRDTADQPGRMYGGLNKTSQDEIRAKLFKMYGVDLNKKAGWQLWGTDGHSTHEQRGPSVNPYEERLTMKSPPVGWGDEGPQRVRRAFDQIDGAADATSAAGGFGDPSPGPAALG